LKFILPTFLPARARGSIFANGEAEAGIGVLIFLFPRGDGSWESDGDRFTQKELWSWWIPMACEFSSLGFPLEMVCWETNPTGVDVKVERNVFPRVRVGWPRLGIKILVDR
jgi:hypothetical protein